MCSTFKPNDTIMVELPGGGFGLVVIGRLNAERMFCTSLGPRFERYPDDEALHAWEPEFSSSWVVDTLGLRDGSWVIVKEPAALANVDLDVRTLRRFAFENKAGEKKLAEYDPDTLFVRTIVDATDFEEYTHAPNFLPQDATSFEVFLSNTLQAPCDLPDIETVERLNADREVVALLRESVSDLGLTLVFDHVFLFERLPDAQETRAKLMTAGVDVAEPVGADDDGPNAIEIRLRSKAEYPLVREDVKRMQRLAAECGADYDGFGAQAL